MPFFLHFFNSDSVRPLVSNSLDFQSLLDAEFCDVLAAEEVGRTSSEGFPEEIVMFDVSELVREYRDSSICRFLRLLCVEVGLLGLRCRRGDLEVQ